jgi:hypothetical protein
MVALSNDRRQNTIARGSGKGSREKSPDKSSMAPLRETETGRYGQHRPKFAANVPGVVAEVRMKLPLSSKRISDGYCFIKPDCPSTLRQKSEQHPELRWSRRTPQIKWKVFKMSPTEERVRQSSQRRVSRCLTLYFSKRLCGARLRKTSCR